MHQLHTYWDLVDLHRYLSRRSPEVAAPGGRHGSPGVSCFSPAEVIYVIYWLDGHDGDLPGNVSELKEKRGLAVELLQVVGEFLIAFVAGLCEYIDCWIVVQMLFLRLTVALGACVVQIS